MTHIMHTYLPEWKFLQELCSLVRLAKLECRRVLHNSDIGTAVLRCDENLERPSIFGVGIQSLLRKRQKYRYECTYEYLKE